MRMLTRAKVGARNVAQDGFVLPLNEIEVIDLDTGRQPVDGNGRALLFIEVDTETGIGIAFDPDSKSNQTMEVRRRFQLRHTPHPCST